MGTYLISIGKHTLQEYILHVKLTDSNSGCVTYRRLYHLPLPKCRWSLGRAGLPVNIVALVYSCWCFIWSFFPNAYEVTPVNFNWACVLFVGLMGFATLMYIFHARHAYEGPVVKVITEDSE